jgi:ADP-ribose pyrophosphatase YjhB (NUDIX family)
MFVVRRFVFRLWRFASGIFERVLGRVSLGVRVLAFKDDKVLLVRMTYLRDWYLPGGGVDRGETLLASAQRELREETAFEARDLKLHGIYLNERKGRSDHVALFAAHELVELPGLRPDHEIAEIGFFAVDQLPETTSPATRARITEFLNGTRPPERW